MNYYLIDFHTVFAQMMIGCNFQQHSNQTITRSPFSFSFTKKKIRFYVSTFLMFETSKLPSQPSQRPGDFAQLGVVGSDPSLYLQQKHTFPIVSVMPTFIVSSLDSLFFYWVCGQRGKVMELPLHLHEAQLCCSKSRNELDTALQ